LKKVLAAAAAAACAALYAASYASAAPASCTPTGYEKDGINLTAATINPAGTVTGPIDATGCNIAVYYGPGTTGTVSAADIHGANYFGVVNNGGNVTVTRSSIHDIGESPLDGSQHGNAVYWAFGSSATGSITRNTISNYQKGGIVVNSGSALISGNTVTGKGPVDFIAQNGIQVGYGATAQVLANRVTGNAYTGTSTVSGGIIVVGGPGYGAGLPYTTNVSIVGNTLVGNDVGINLSNLAADDHAPATKTSAYVVGNAIRNDAVTNGYVYQAGISDTGNGDWIAFNAISGLGYTPVGDTVFAIDAEDPSYAANAHVIRNLTP
jgi:hypothetical protein